MTKITEQCQAEHSPAGARTIYGCTKKLDHTGPHQDQLGRSWRNWLEVGPLEPLARRAQVRQDGR